MTARAPSKSRLGWLGPVLVVVGLAVGALGIWYIKHARPLPGDTLDTAQLPAGVKIVVRAELGGDNAFIEVWDGDQLRWTQLIPHYAGSAQRSGLAWSGNTMSVRVERDGREEVWGLGLPDGTKGGSLFLAPEHEPIPRQLANGSGGPPLTQHDDHQSYELVGGADWHEVVAIDLPTGKAAWKRDLGGAQVTGFALHGDQIDIEQGSAHLQLRAVDGTPL